MPGAVLGAENAAVNNNPATAFPSRVGLTVGIFGRAVAFEEIPFDDIRPKAPSYWGDDEVWGTHEPRSG